MRIDPLRLGCFALCALGAAARTAAAQDLDYDAALTRAAELERDARFADAAHALEPVAARYPDDYALALRTAWLEFRAARWDAARAYYARALALSQGSALEARLGLAYTLRAQGHRARARREFDRVLRRDPRNALALAGVALLRAEERPEARVFPALFTGAAFYAGHPLRHYAYSVSPSLTLQLGSGLLVGLAYRSLGYDFASANVSPSNRQEELFVSLGLWRPDFTVRFHAGVALDASNPMLPAYALGASLQLRRLGVLDAEGSATFFADASVARAAARWEFDLSPALRLGPTLGVQFGGAGLLGSAGASATLHSGAYSLQLAARYGDEFRPTYLNDSLTYATNDRVRAAVTATGRVPLGLGLSLTLGYEWLRLSVAAPGGPLDADAHVVSAGITSSF